MLIFDKSTPNVNLVFKLMKTKVKLYIFFDTHEGNAILGPWGETVKMIISMIDDEYVIKLIFLH